jgi:predicted dehydrogenase
MEVLGITSRSTESAESAAALARSLNLGPAKAYGSVTEMVADPAIDALWICAPNFTRIAVMEEICEAVVSGKGSLLGVACEKPLGRNVAEARQVRDLALKAGLLDGYLENQVFAPSVVRGREIVWARGAAATGRPYMARAAEEHSGPHMPWFWDGELQGGGVLNDMLCHSVEVARYMLTEPGAPRDSITPVSINAFTDCLKWQRPEYAKMLSESSAGETDYLKHPAEDFARAMIEYRDSQGQRLVVDATTSWNYVGAGLRLSMELLGPEYSMSVNTLDTDLKVFFSRAVIGKQAEDLVEKQNAEAGLMPVVGNEQSTYGYESENRHMVQSFLAGERPRENFDDGLAVTELLMAAYMSAEQGRTIKFPPEDLESFVPAVAKGEWNPNGG